MSADAIGVRGIVRHNRPSDLHDVEVVFGAVRRRVICRRAGKLNQRRIRVLPGDRVTVELSPYDPTRGRITWRD